MRKPVPFLFEIKIRANHKTEPLITCLAVGLVPSGVRMEPAPELMFYLGTRGLAYTSLSNSWSANRHQ